MKVHMGHGSGSGSGEREGGGAGRPKQAGRVSRKCVGDGREGDKRNE